MKRIESVWKSASDQTRFPTSGFDWYYSCAENLNQGSTLSIVHYTNESGTAIAPLVKYGEGLGEHYEIIGSRQLGEPSSLLVTNTETLRGLIDCLLKLRRPCYLSRLYLTKNITIPETTVGPFSGIVLKKIAQRSPYISINSSWQDYVNRMPSRKRYDLKRGPNRSKKFGDITFKMISPHTGNFSETIHIAIQIESSGWKGRNKSSLRHNSFLKSFFSQYLYQCCKKDCLRVALLYLNNHPIAMLVGIEKHNSFWVLKIGYDEQWKHLSPGIQIVNHALNYCFKEKMKRFEFLGHDELWIKKWDQVKYREYLSLFIFPANVYGAYALSRDVFATFKARYGHKSTPSLNGA